MLKLIFQKIYSLKDVTNDNGPCDRPDKNSQGRKIEKDLGESPERHQLSNQEYKDINDNSPKKEYGSGGEGGAKKKGKCL